MTDDNAQVDTSRGDTAKDDGGDLLDSQYVEASMILGSGPPYLGGVQGTDGEVETQSHTEDQLADQEGRTGSGEEFSEDASARNHHADSQAHSSARPVGNNTAEEASEELSHGRDRVEGTQPGGGDHPVLLEPFAKVTSEGGDGEHRTVDLGIETPVWPQRQN